MGGPFFLLSVMLPTQLSHKPLTLRMMLAFSYSVTIVKRMARLLYLSGIVHISFFFFLLLFAVVVTVVVAVDDGKEDDCKQP